MILTRTWKLILLTCLVTVGFGLSGIMATAAPNYNCSDPGAPWNRSGEAQSPDDKLSGTRTFSCQSDPDVNAYTRIQTVYSKNGSCSNDYGCAICPSNTTCAAEVDCESRFGSDGYSCQEKSANMECIIFHCSQGMNNTCCREKKSVESDIKEDPGGDIGVPMLWDSSTKTTTPATTTPASSSIISFSLSDCCQSIVRPLSRNTETGIVTDKYTLNDIVQAAVNIYECILCIVGALMLIMTVIGATMLILSGGSADKVALGKRIIVGAVVGGIIAFTTYLIIYWTVTALGAEFLSPYSAPSGSGDLRVDPGSSMNVTETIQ